MQLDTAIPVVSLSIVVTLLVSFVVALYGQTYTQGEERLFIWHIRRRKLTKVGWSAVGLLVTAFGLTAFDAYLNDEQDQQREMRSRWSEALSSIWPLQYAITKCVEKSGGAMVAPCDTASGLKAAGFLSPTYNLPNGFFSSVTMKGGVITVVGSPYFSNCTVTMSPSASTRVWPAHVSVMGRYASHPGTTSFFPERRWLGVVWNRSYGSGCDSIKTGVGL